MRIALFGGTFDPIHWGHLILAESAREAFHLDRVLFVPSGIPPHKAPPRASAQHRLAMIRRAIASSPAFQVSDWEIRQHRTVYSYETIAHFRQTSSRQELFFIVGSDSIQAIDFWRGGRSLLGQCTFLVVERPGVPWRTLPATVRRKVRHVPAPAIPLASHAIRARIRQGRSIRYRVAEPVERYIRLHRLYRTRSR
jgi:nicotinate-nucleotide adenylyltransferase